MGKLNNKVAIVTGAARGIGAGIAKRLAAEGAAVVVNYASSREAAERTVKEIVAAGGKAIAVRGDVAEAAEVEKMFEAAEIAFGKPSILINNAATASFGTFEETSEADYRRLFDTNVLGTILTTKAAMRHFPETGGSIVNIGTISSWNPVPNTSLYSASKAAIDTLTLSLSRELGARNIRVNIVAPGYTHTEMTEGMVGTDFGNMLIAGVPLGQRFGKPDDIAPTVAFLASDEAAWLTGERINASGGAR